MNPLILRTSVRIHLYLLTLFSFYLLIRGHNEPGGGFIAGLLTASAMVLQALAFDARYASSLVPVREQTLIGLGLLLAVGTGVASMLFGRPFLDHVFHHTFLPFLGEVELASAVVFDIGVYLVVVGVAKWTILTVATGRAGQSGPGS
ncbi:MAG: Na(+)/H(+) antiporter subunit B [Firmicutes bacterium]|nr:Na(+)/H(+) antiporter subunit B [Bacillota bacterium]